MSDWFGSRSHGADGQCRARPRNARADARPRGEAGRGGRGRRGRPRDGARAGAERAAADGRGSGVLDGDRRVRGARRGPARAPRADPPRRSGGDGAAEERRPAAAGRADAASSRSSGRTPGWRRSWAAARRSSTRITASRPGRGWRRGWARTALLYAPGCHNHRWEPLIEGDLTVEFFDSTDLPAPVVHSETMAASIAFWFPPFAGGKVDASALLGPHHRPLHRHRSPGRTTSASTPPASPGSMSTARWWSTPGSGWTKGRTFFEEGNDERGRQRRSRRPDKASR